MLFWHLTRDEGQNTLHKLWVHGRLIQKARSGVEVNKRKKNSSEIWGYSMHVDRTTQLLFPGMRLNTSYPQGSNVITMNWCIEIF